MKKHLLLSLILTIALFSNVTYAQNLATNGDFETWASGTPTGWTTIETGITIAEEATIKHGGAKSMHVTLTTTTQGNTDFRQQVTLTAGLTYNVSVWVYHIDTLSSVSIYAAGAWTNLYSDRFLTNQWQQINYTFVAATSGAQDFGLRFYDQPTDAASVAAFTSAVLVIDDFSVTAAASTAPVITNIAINPTTPTSSDVVNVSATISDDGTIASAYLYWSTDGVTYADSIVMNGTVNSTFTTASGIPAQALGTTVFYKIKAIDNATESFTTTANSYHLSILAPNDVAIIQYRTDAIDGFSFVVLRTISQQFSITFTDIAWSGSAFTTSEGKLVWTSPASGVTAGTVVGVQADSTDLGTAVKYNSFDFAATGDNIFAFTGDVTNPVFLFGLSNLPWVTTGSVTNNNSYLPSSLTTGTTAISFTTMYENGYYNVTPITGSVAEILASITNEANWTFENDGTVLLLQPSAYWTITVGTQTIEMPQSVSIYPNPMTNSLNVNNLQNVSKITVSNMIGQQVMEMNVNTENTILNVEELEQGIYFVNIFDNQNNVSTFKVVKK